MLAIKSTPSLERAAQTLKLSDLDQTWKIVQRLAHAPLDERDPLAIVVGKGWLRVTADELRALTQPSDTAAFDRALKQRLVAFHEAQRVLFTPESSARTPRAESHERRAQRRADDAQARAARQARREARKAAAR